MKTDIIQKAIVLNEADEMLILRRSETDERRPLQWDLPGGMLEDGEEMIYGVEREIAEESGLSVSGTRVIFSNSIPKVWATGQANIVRIYYGAHTKTTAVTLSTEHSEYRWLSIQDAINCIEYNLHRELLQYVIDNKLVL